VDMIMKKMEKGNDDTVVLYTVSCRCLNMILFDSCCRQFMLPVPVPVVSIVFVVKEILH